jgi:hypothetical protein
LKNCLFTERIRIERGTNAIQSAYLSDFFISLLEASSIKIDRKSGIDRASRNEIAKFPIREFAKREAFSSQRG